MAKKKGKGKKGKKGKKKENPEELTEVEREIFAIQIKDLTAKVERLKARCLELEASNTEFEENYKQLDEDRGDAINFLKKEVDQKQEEITELEDRIQGLVQARENDVSMYKEKIKQNDHDFKIMHENLTSEIKLLTGKLNSLEDFRVHREDLVKKFKRQEEMMNEQDESHKQLMYEVEKKFIIGKDKLKKEMEGKLLQLSSNFADATEIRIAATTHHAIRENIAINNELDLMIATHCKLTAENEQMKQVDKERQLKLALVEEEKHILLKKNSVLLKLLNRLAREHQDMELSLAELEHDAQKIEDTQTKLEKAEEALKEAELHTRIELQKLHGALYEQNQLRIQAEEAKLRGDKLMAVIDQCVSAIQEVMNIPEGQDDAFVQHKRETLLARLLQLMDASTIQYIPVPAGPGMERKSWYETGDLGLVPKTSSTSITRSKGSEKSYESSQFSSSQSQGSHGKSVRESRQGSESEQRKSAREPRISKRDSLRGSRDQRDSQHDSQRDSIEDTLRKSHSDSKHGSRYSKHESVVSSKSITSIIKNKSTFSIVEQEEAPSEVQIKGKLRPSTISKRDSVLEEVVEEVMKQETKEDSDHQDDDDKEVADIPTKFADEESGEK